MTQLEPCPQCHRHVFITETSCPFCAHSLADAFANVEPRVFPRARLGRAATFAFGALGVLALSQAGCTEGGRSPQDAARADAPTDAALDAGIPGDADDDGGVAIYASAPTPPADGGTTTVKG